MRLRPLAVVVAAGLFIGPVLAQKQKPANDTEILSPPAIAQAPRPCDATCPPACVVSPAPTVSQVSQNLLLEFHYTLTREPAAKMPVEHSRSRQVMKVYSVADLVVPLPTAEGCCAVATAPPKTLEAELIHKITAAVEPKSWSCAGGPGTIEHHPLGLALVVNQTPEVQAAVARFLEALRRVQDQQVVTELYLMTVSDDWFEKAGLAEAFGRGKGGTPRAQFLSSEAATKLVRAAADDAAMSMMQAPKITTLTGQPGRVRVGDVEQFVTGLTAKSVDGNVLLVPTTESHDLGVDLRIEPTVAADGKSVRMIMAGTVRELGVIPVPMTPVTTKIKPVPEPGKTHEPVPFTQYLQEPKIVTRTVTDTVVIPDGGTVMLYGGKATIEETVKDRIPSLSDVPIVAELFVRERKVTKTNHLIVLASVRVMRPEIGCEECEACCSGNGKLTKLLADYQHACREGKVDEARRLAIECLAIDATCFGKK